MVSITKSISKRFYWKTQNNCFMVNNVDRMNRIHNPKTDKYPDIEFHCICTRIDLNKRKYFIHNWHFQAWNPKSSNCRWALFLTYFDKRGYCCELGFTLCFTFFKSSLIFLVACLITWFCIYRKYDLISYNMVVTIYSSVF